MTAASLIPTAIDALLALYRGALPETCPVMDGGVIRDIERAALYVGMTLEEGTRLVDVPFTQSWAGNGHTTSNESIELSHYMYVRSGDVKDPKPLRDELFGYYNTINGVLQNDPSLGLATRSVRARIDEGLYSQPPIPDGLICRLHFIVHIEGRL